MRSYLFTSESVTEGHPDKLCDLVSDAILDAHLAADPYSRVACETVVKSDLMVIAGEITSNASVDVEAVARETIAQIGYTDNSQRFSADNCKIIVKLERQSGDIAMGVDRSLESKGGEPEELGAGDQGMMFGYACSETPELMPLPLTLAHRLCRRLTEARRSGLMPYLRPDGKAQVTVEYRDGRAARVEAVVVSAQHDEQVEMELLRADIRQKVIDAVIDPSLIDQNTRFFINPTGRFAIGGPEGDSGLTGRKIIVDTYGGSAHHGGGAFSGKDPTKVDRSGAYMARYIAKNIVAAGLADRCEIQLAYAIGVARPVSLLVEAFGTEKAPVERIESAVNRLFDLRPAGIIETLGLRSPIYRQLAAYGHIGREELGLRFEQIDRAVALGRAVLG